MPDRDVMLHNIEAAYAARTRADREELATYWAPGGTYRLVGADNLPGIAAGANRRKRGDRRAHRLCSSSIRSSAWPR